MHGVPVDLSKYIPLGKELIQICIGQFETQFHFFDKGWIQVESKWTLKDKDQNIVDFQEREKEKNVSHLPLLLGKKISSVTIDPPKSFTLIFEHDFELTIFDDSEKYESFSIQPGNVFI